MEVKTRLTGLIVLLACTLAQQISGAEHLQVSVVNVTENRRTKVTRWDSCEVELAFTGTAVAESLGILDVRILSAENDLGEDIAPQRSDDRPSMYPRPPIAETDDEKKVTRSLRLKPSSRKAATFSLRGEVDLLQPDLVPHSRIVLTNLIINPNVWLDSPGLSNARVKIMFVGRENFEAFTRSWQEQRMGAHITTSSLNGQNNVKNALRFHIEDPNRTVIKVDIQDAGAVSLRPRATMLSEKYRLFGFSSRPDADVQLVVYVDHPDARRTLAFRLVNIPLP